MPEVQQQEVIYKFISEAFKIGDDIYNVVLTPELYADAATEEDGGLDFTGTFVGILIHPQHGTISFELQPTMSKDNPNKWKMEVLEPGIIQQNEAEINPVGDLGPMYPYDLRNSALISEIDRIIRKTYPDL